mmetsp:Transcript_2963/g.8100  ORF Transcript_2963/g.8100 Transcript_2963/m.8100 type:complete len:1071 (+) Transcript_2963:150-3362(+)|eukprot:CAMPEP_0197189190 /NCGR_PEP_ID=MMETSP1423-20130617/19314_1 /TAXON_ID=476441 /ORGANISM="Pseudo-nitzschia heimii, Strain UNC1101" /LENGTH=1070 /DNA_ID=CAMNT_0042641241 /DNA_START=127 /DNA_END=3339 /DNA_ORIENTATION=-
MRQIITPSPWSSSTNANGHFQNDGKMSLSAIETSTNRGETDSSFEVPTVNNNFRDRRTHSKRAPTKPFSRGTNDSMQFVPADHQTDNKFVGTNETSWDTLANDSRSNGNQRRSAARSVVTSSQPTSRAMSKHKKFTNKMRKHEHSEGMTSDYPASFSVNDAAQFAGGESKIGRLASMFSSRATPAAVPMRASKPDGQQDVPSSPPRSESSTGYVEWPGTQDKQGITVVAGSSYEESDSSAGNHNFVDEGHTNRNVLDYGNSEGHGSYSPRRSYSGSEHEQEKIHRLATNKQNSSSSFIPQNQVQLIQDSSYGDNTDSLSDLSASYSKTSSAYFNPGEVQAIQKGDAKRYFDGVDQYRNRLAAATVMRRCLSSSKMSSNKEQPLPVLTEEKLAMQNRISAPSRSFNYGTSAGYRGLLDRTKDVPNLIDDTTSDCTSRISTARSRHMEENEHKNGLVQASLSYRKEPENVNIDKQKGNNGLIGATSWTGIEKLNLALLGGGLTTIQTTTGDFTNRKTASDFDDTLTNSDCDQYGFVKIPGLHEMISAGTSKHDRSLTSQSLQFANDKSDQQHFLPRSKDQTDQFDFLVGKNSAIQPPYVDAIENFSQYYINPEEMQTVVKKFRKISMERCKYFDYEELDREEDATKAFALSEMRSRIMEKDIERGLERRGGTTVVDDIVMTSYHKSALRVRDAVIVAKAWRDGATPQDVINTANLTRRDQRRYYVPRFDASAKDASQYSWEEVEWVDDNDLSQYRCHSLGPRHLKGAEMFTIGDCQSILLKLSNDRCQELRVELNEATANQIKAEGLMKAEGETFDGTMTEAEMAYLTSMENVKSISQKLVLAEKSFALVKNRIEKLVAKYEALLVHFENETDSIAPSSVFSYESSCYSEDYSFAAAKQREDQTLARRAHRAELRAELAARESLLSSQGMTPSRREKEKEVDNLKARIADLHSETSTAFTDRNRSVALARAITRSNQNSRAGNENGEASNRSYNRSKIDDIKQRFRNRSAVKFQFDSKKKLDSVPRNGNSSFHNVDQAVINRNGNSFHRMVGEEMFQHLDFYERSLQAVGDH